MYNIKIVVQNTSRKGKFFSNKNVEGKNFILNFDFELRCSMWVTCSSYFNGSVKKIRVKNKHIKYILVRSVNKPIIP